MRLLSLVRKDSQIRLKFARMSVIATLKNSQTSTLPDR